MPFKRLLLTIGLFSMEALASNISANGLSESSEVALSIKPVACIAKRAGETCQMTITTHWQSIVASDLCLFKDEQQMHCWQQKQQVKQKFNILLEHDALFSLKNQNGDVLAHQQVTINVSDSVKFRRRLRSEWSIF